jgi:hypothetical protein
MESRFNYYAHVLNLLSIDSIQLLFYPCKKSNGFNVMLGVIWFFPMTH